MPKGQKFGVSLDLWGNN